MTREAAHIEEREELPAFFAGVRGRVRAQVPLAKRCWFQVGGPAEWLFTPEDVDDLCLFMRQLPKEVPLFVLGVGSNLLVRDGGLDGVVVRLGRGFASIAPSPFRERGGERVPGNETHPLPNPPPGGGGENCIYTGAAALDVNVAAVACDHGIAGLEFLSGIPGTIGGALAMNAGAYGREIKEVIVEVVVVDDGGEIRRLKPEELKMTYRHTEIPERWVFTGAVLRGAPGNKAEIAKQIEAIERERHLTQPVRARTGGSTFKNPPGEKAWRRIEEAGCRGLTEGQAQVSPLHCNFLINMGDATARELEILGETVRKRVQEKSGVTLEWEIKRVGKA